MWQRKTTEIVLTSWAPGRVCGSREPQTALLGALIFLTDKLNCLLFLLQPRASMHLESESWAASSVFTTLGPGSGITHLINLPLFIIRGVSLKKTTSCCHPRGLRGPFLRPAPWVSVTCFQCPQLALSTRHQGPPLEPCRSSPSLQLHRARPPHYAVLLGAVLKAHPSELEPFCQDTEHVLNGAKKFKWEEIIA